MFPLALVSIFASFLLFFRRALQAFRVQRELMAAIENNRFIAAKLCTYDNFLGALRLDVQFTSQDMEPLFFYGASRDPNAKATTYVLLN